MENLLLCCAGKIFKFSFEFHSGRVDKILSDHQRLALRNIYRNIMLPNPSLLFHLVSL